jgi:hypothetical protein
MSITRKGLLWGYGVQTTNVATPVAAAAGLRVRAEGGVSDLKSGMTHVDVEMQDGEWGRRDYTQYAGVVRPHWTGAPLLLSTGLIQKLVQQVCAEGTPDGSGNITYTLQATGVAPSTTKSLSIIRRNALATSKDKRLVGATIKSLKLSSSESQNAVHMDCDFLGIGLAYTFDGSGGTYTVPAESFLLHKNMTFKIGAATTKCPEYDVTLDFGTVAEVDNAGSPSSFLLGMFTATGTVRIPWADEDVLADFETSVGNTLTFLWGTAGTSGYLEIIVPVKYTDPDEDIDLDVRLRQGMPFQYFATSGQALQIKLKP